MKAWNYKKFGPRVMCSGMTGTLIILSSTEWKPSKESVESHKEPKVQVLEEQLGLESVMEQPETVRIRRKPRDNAKKTKRKYFKEEVINPTECS